MKIQSVLFAVLVLNWGSVFSQDESRGGPRGRVESVTDPDRKTICLKGSMQEVQRVRKTIQAIDKMFSDYVKYWGDGDFEKISGEVYDVPFSLFKQEKTEVFVTKKQVKDFLVKTFRELEKNNYGHSKTNGWEHYKLDGGLAVIEMNFTRYLKNGEIMGPQKRTATYILRKAEAGYRIVGMVPHTTVGR
jgi:hypothetical protein